MGIIGWIVFGLIVGVLAKVVMPGKDPGGIVVTSLIGIVGALLGGFIGRALNFYGPDEPAGFVVGHAVPWEADYPRPSRATSSRMAFNVRCDHIEGWDAAAEFIGSEPPTPVTASAQGV